LFHEEPTFVLQDDLRDSVQAASVLALIGQGVARPAELAGRLQVPATALGRPLRRLLDLGLISREIPFGCAEKTNKRTLYRISDPFLRFWYTFGLPNYSDPYYLSSPEEVEAVRPAFQVFLGQAWESLVRETLCGRPLPGGEGRWRNISRWWGIGRDRKPMEIDIVAESVDRRTLLVGEVKLSLAESELCHVKRNLEGKVARLPFASRYEHIDLRVFVAKGCPCGAISLDWADWGAAEDGTECSSRQDEFQNSNSRRGA
jgi:AAA+ ATPase superfamily predicted ATPase